MAEILTVLVRRRRGRRRSAEQTAGYHPTLRLELVGHDGLVLARAYDRWQARWGDPRRAFVTGDLPRRRAGAAP